MISGLWVPDIINFSHLCPIWGDGFVKENKGTPLVPAKAKPLQKQLQRWPYNNFREYWTHLRVTPCGNGPVLGFSSCQDRKSMCAWSSASKPALLPVKTYSRCGAFGKETLGITEVTPTVKTSCCFQYSCSVCVRAWHTTSVITLLKQLHTPLTVLRKSCP